MNVCVDYLLQEEGVNLNYDIVKIGCYIKNRVI